MNISEQPGRLFAIFILSPYLIFCGYKYKNIILFILGILFFIYELFWITFYNPKNINFTINIK